jgi:hypothetical protein
LISTSNRKISIQTDVICSINLRRLGFWLNKGALIRNTRVSWLVGLLASNDNDKC